MWRALATSLLIVAALAGVASAQSPGVGQPAPDFTGANWVLNTPETSKVSELRGEVIVIEHWGVR